MQIYINGGGVTLDRCLCKAKRKDNGEWITGYFAYKTICTVCNTYVGPVIYEPITKVYEDSWTEIDLSSLGRYTGLQDIHGTRIFEGDIIKHMQDVCPYPEYSCDAGAVVHADSRYCRTSLICPDSLPDLSYKCRYEVVSNVHDDPNWIDNVTHLILNNKQ